MNYGTDLKLKKGYGGGEHKAGKDRSRPGAAKGQGEGMGGYNASTVNKAMQSVVGGGGKPCYYNGGAKMER